MAATEDEVKALEQYIVDTFQKGAETREIARFILKTNPERNALVKTYIQTKKAALATEKTTRDQEHADKLNQLNDLDSLWLSDDHKRWIDSL